MHTTSMFFVGTGPINIFFCVFVSIYTMSLFYINSWNTYSSEQIFFLRNWFKMIWIYTLSISTQMIDLIPLWYGALIKFVCSTMRIALFCVNPDNSIIRFFTPCARSYPKPACGSFFGVFDKTRFKFHNIMLFIASNMLCKGENECLI